MKLTRVANLLLLCLFLVQVVACKSKVKSLKEEERDGYVEKQFTLTFDSSEYENINIEGIDSSQILITSNEGKVITITGNILADSEKTYKRYITRNQINTVKTNELTIYIAPIGYFNCAEVEANPSKFQDFTGACISKVAINIPPTVKANIFINNLLAKGKLTFEMVIDMVRKQRTVFDQKKTIKHYFDSFTETRFITVRDLERLFDSLRSYYIIDDIAKLASGHLIDPQNVSTKTISYAIDYTRDDVRELLMK